MCSSDLSYNIEIIVTYLFISHGLTFLYSSLLFFLHYHCREWEQKNKTQESRGYWTHKENTADNYYQSVLTEVEPNNIVAYAMNCTIIGAVLVFTMIPTFPVKDHNNCSWFLPQIYCIVTIGGAIWVEHLFDGNDKTKQQFKMDVLPHMLQFLQTFILLKIGRAHV